MDQVRGETHQQERPSTPLTCPRCNSEDTKFRYFNNHSSTQPRHHCNNCNRQWTEGGSIRNIPFGGKPMSVKLTKASSSRSANLRSQSPQPPLLPLPEEYLHNSQFLTPMATIIPQNFGTTMIHPFINMPATRSPLNSNYFNDEISCLDAIQSLFQPDITNQYAAAENQFAGGRANMATPQEWSMQPEFGNQHALGGGNEFVLGGTDMEIPQEWSIQPEALNQHVLGGNKFVSSGANISIPQEWSMEPEVNRHVLGENEFDWGGASMVAPQDWSMQPEVNQHVLDGNEFVFGGANMKIPKEWGTPTASQQTLPQQIPGHVESCQTQFQVNNTPHSYNNSLVQSTWPVNLSPFDVTTNSSFPTSNASLGNNFSGNITEAEMDTTSVNVDEWLNFPGYDPL